jgi:apolipoprotein N-acyltransferase
MIRTEGQDIGYKSGVIGSPAPPAMPTRLAEYSLAAVSAVWLNLCFPIAGPLPPGRTAWGWVGLLPLLLALLARRPEGEPRYLLRSFLLAWICGVIWYAINCYWIYQTMFLYGGLPAPVSAGILLLFSLIMGLYFGLFGWLLGFVRRAAGVSLALVLAPFLWIAIELLGAHLIKVPWDQLGYSQVGNFLLTRLAPYTGVYGISFVLVAVNVILTAGLLARTPRTRWGLLAGGAIAAVVLQAGTLLPPPPAPTEATAVLLQENLSVQESNLWMGPVWDENTSRFREASERTCTPYLQGMPELNAQVVVPECRQPVPISLVVWPEAPSPFRENDPRLRTLMHDLTTATQAPVIVGNIAIDARPQHTDYYNAASVFTADGQLLGRYEKIHLVPWGEYIPYQDFFSFAHRLTGNAGDLTHGSRRTVFRVKGHTYGVFICYESIFADEIRQFAANGAEVLVNISDDGWYGDTSAPWQHLNMARMRAIENRRWLLRDTNTGVTTAIDPYGRLTMSAPRHVFTSLAVRYGFRDDLTFYTRYGDLFAMLCGIISLAVLARGVRVAVRGLSVKSPERQV